MRVVVVVDDLAVDVVVVAAVAVGGLCDSPWLNSSNLARPVDGRRPAALFPDDSSTRMDRDRVKRFAKRGLLFFWLASRSVAVFFGPVCCMRFSPEDAPSV